jgi:polyribonucleotide nucleotidyltransferase
MITPIEKRLHTGGREIILETGKLARQSDGAVVLKCDGTVILATVVAAQEAKPGIDFMPLTIEYREKYAATGRFPGGYFKREARPTDSEILTSRLIDRALRPLFPSDFHADTQVLVYLLSCDGEVLPDALACFAASAAIAVSDIPIQEAISEVRVGRINGEFVINPTKTALQSADLDIMVAGTADSIVMVEGEMKEVSEAVMLDAIKHAHEAIKAQCAVQVALAAEAGKEKRTYNHEENDEDLRKQLREATFQACFDLACKGTGKKERSEGFKEILNNFKAQFDEETLTAKEGMIKRYFHDVESEAMRRMILDKKVRLDGRGTAEIRSIWSEIDYLPYTHGSAVFTRGETQALATVTLGNKRDEQEIDGVVFQGAEKFILHYNFPPFSTGEARPMRGTSRREIGHGNLAFRALKPMIEFGVDMPYTVRVVSEVLESNGSSSMATVCSGSLALMDAGVKMKKPVSGIAMGLILEDNGNFAVLSDILGDEDHLGDMDFKVAGTVDGITACQMDIKVGGLTYEIMETALSQAKDGRMHILNEMSKTITASKPDYKPHAPRIIMIEIPKEYIGAVIGPGGKIIQEIQATTNTVISIEEEGNVGKIEISSKDKASIDMALARIKGIVSEPEVGEVYKGKVKSIMPYGAFVEILPGKDGLLHVSELDWKRVNDVTDYLKEGDLIDVKLIDIDPKTKKLKLSRKELLEKPVA